MKRIIIGLASAVSSIAGLIFFFYMGSSVMVAPPENLLILVDHKYQTFISPECLSPNVDYESPEFEVADLHFATKILDYDYDSTCTYDSIWPSRNSLWNFVGTKLGFLQPLNWKWNDDGSWKEEALYN